MIRAWLIAALLGPSPVIVPPPANGPLLNATDVSIPTYRYCFGTVATNDITCYDEEGAIGATRSTDSAAQPVAVVGQGVYSQATVNTTPGDVVVSGGPGRHFFTVDDYSTIVDTETVVVRVMLCDGSVTNTTRTAGTPASSTVFDPGTSNAVTASGIATVLDTITGVDAVASSASVYVTIDPTEAQVCQIGISETGTGISKTEGADGVFRMFADKQGNGGTTQSYGGAVTFNGNGGFIFRNIDGTTTADAISAEDYTASAATAGFATVASGAYFIGGSASEYCFATTATGITVDTCLKMNSSGKLGFGTTTASYGGFDFACFTSAALDMSVTTKQTVMTTPTGKTFKPVSLTFKDASATVDTVAGMTAGCDAGATNSGFGTMALTTTNSVSATLHKTFHVTVQGTECASTEVFGIDIGTPEGAADTAIVQVCGFID